MTRTLLLLLGLLAGCATVPTQPSKTQSSEDQVPPMTTTKSCAFDIDCPGGSCQFGECSPFPRPPDNTIGIGQACISGIDCSNNICQGADCH